MGGSFTAPPAGRLFFPVGRARNSPPAGVLLPPSCRGERQPPPCLPPVEAVGSWRSHTVALSRADQNALRRPPGRHQREILPAGPRLRSGSHRQHCQIAGNQLAQTENYGLGPETALPARYSQSCPYQLRPIGCGIAAFSCAEAMLAVSCPPLAAALTKAAWSAPACPSRCCAAARSLGATSMSCLAANPSR